MKNLNNAYVESILKKAIADELPSRQAAAKLGITRQYLNKLKSSYQQKGRTALEHGNSGRSPSWKADPETEKKVIELYQGKYHGFNFRRFLEKLNEEEGIRISYRPLYRILTEAGVRSPSSHRIRRKKDMHPSRPRRKRFGELLQIDASIHPWFGEGRPKATPHGAIDDSTGIVMGLWFDREETLAGYYEMMWQILSKYGIP